MGILDYIGSNIQSEEKEILEYDEKIIDAKFDKYKEEREKIQEEKLKQNNKCYSTYNSIIKSLMMESDVDSNGSLKIYREDLKRYKNFIEDCSNIKIRYGDHIADFSGLREELGRGKYIVSTAYTPLSIRRRNDD